MAIPCRPIATNLLHVGPTARLRWSTVVSLKRHRYLPICKSRRMPPPIASGAFPSGGFKPSYLAGPNSPAFFYSSHHQMAYCGGTFSPAHVVSPQKVHDIGKCSTPTDKSDGSGRSRLQTNQEACRTGSRTLGCSKCQGACFNQVRSSCIGLFPGGRAGLAGSDQ